MRANEGQILAGEIEQFLRGIRGHQHGLRIRLLHRAKEIFDSGKISGVVAPNFVSDLPILHVIGRGMPVGGAFCAPFRLRVVIAIPDQVGSALRTVSEAHADQGFGSQRFAELAKLIDSDIVGVVSSPRLV
jgi:hypothetical protein